MANTTSMLKAGAIGLVMAASTFSAAPALAQEGGLFQAILGATGLMPSSGPAIEYRERAPLVVPPTRELPPPVTPDALTANPQWPEDATLRAQRERATPRLRDDRVLTMEEMRAGRGGVANSSWIHETDEGRVRPLTREELANTHRVERVEGLTRRSLSDPPSALLQPVPTN
jgi:hypothetical protein